MVANDYTKPICPSSALVDGGAGVRFNVHLGGARPAPAFVVRYGGVVYGYLNVCTHRWTELDWERGKFFNFENRWLICATHGALYDPVNGRCVGGPCRGERLTALPVCEQEGQVSLILRDGLDLA